MEQACGFFRHDVGIRARVLVVVFLYAKGFRLEITPGQRTAFLKLEVGLGDVVNKFLSVVPVRPPGNVPGQFQITAADGSRWPIEWQIPWSFSTTPGLAIESAHVVRRTTLPAHIVGQNAHELINSVGVDGSRRFTGFIRRAVRRFVHPAMGIPGRRIRNQSVRQHLA